MSPEESNSHRPTRSPFSSSSRTTTTLLLVCGGLVAVGSIGGSLLIERVKMQFYSLQSAAERRQTEAMARLLSRDVQNGRPAADIIARFQSSIQGTAGDGSYVCLLDANGILLSHPNPGMIGMSKAAVATRGLDSTSSSTYGSLVANALPASAFALDDRQAPDELIFLQPVSGTSWTLASHENARAIEAQFRKLGLSLFAVVAPTVGLMALVGTALARATGRRYERRIEEANAQLETRVAERTAELERTLKELRQAHERLVQGEKMHLLGELMAGIAHEIANPLTVVNGYGMMLATRNPDPNVRRIGQRIEDGAERARRIVGNLLAFARRQPPARKPESIVQIIERAIELIAADLRRADITLRCEFPDTCEPVAVDAQQIEQVFLNLLNNARQALANHPGPREIRIRLRGNVGAGVEISIVDSGPGLPAAIRKQLFRTFFTTKTEGTGIGLSLCRRFVEAHGGTIDAPLRENGTEFLIRLPRIERAAQREPAAPLEAVAV